MADLAKSKLLAAGRIFMLAGLGAMVAGVALWGAEWNASRHKSYAVATVTENEEIIDARGGVRYIPRLRFRAAGGMLVQVMGREGGDTPEFGVGERVRVAYAVGAEQEAVVDTVWEMYEASALVGATGAVLFDAGAVVWWLGRRRTVRDGTTGGHEKNRKVFAALFGRNGGYRP